MIRVGKHLRLNFKTVYIESRSNLKRFKNRSETKVLPKRFYWKLLEVLLEAFGSFHEDAIA